MTSNNKTFLTNNIDVRVYNCVEEKFEQYADFQEFNLHDASDVFVLLQACKKANKYVEIVLDYPSSQSD